MNAFWLNADKTVGNIKTGNSTVVYDASHRDWEWFKTLDNITPYTPPPEPTPSELLEQERAAMSCSPMQGMLALGETEWAKVQSYRDTDATWAEKVIIDKAGDWRRNSQNIAFFQHLLDYTPEQVDDLFRAAMEIVA